jgi:hypothetical protein
MPGQQIVHSPATDLASATDYMPSAELPTVRLVTVPNWADPGVEEGGGGTIAAAREPPRDGQPGGGQPAWGQPGDWPQRFARMVTEALAGSRPARQITPWTSKRARSQFHRLKAGFPSADEQPRIIRVVATRPTRDAIEMSVIAGFGPRTRAFALRLERLPEEDRRRLASARRLPWPDAVMTASGGWICTDIEAA